MSTRWTMNANILKMCSVYTVAVGQTALAPDASTIASITCDVQRGPLFPHLL